MTKKYDIESTPKQVKAVNNIIEQKLRGERNLGKALKDAGYSDHVAHTPKGVTESKGFKQAMADAGITETSISKMLGEDLRAKEGNRLGEMKLATELLGGREQNLNVNVNTEKNFDLIESLIETNGDKGDSNKCKEATEEGCEQAITTLQDLQSEDKD
jgi:hypothetical protein